jgi:hypothetical protein
MTAALLPEIALFALLSHHMTQHSPGEARVLFFEFVDPAKMYGQKAVSNWKL